MFLATVLIEPNRWNPSEPPLFSWQQETGRALLAAGFSGVELWQKHWTLANSAQRQWMKESPCPVRIFSHYGAMDGEAQNLLLQVTAHFQPTLRGIKFNLGSDPSRFEQEHAAVKRLADELPGHAKLLCECHGGTVLEKPDDALRALQQWPDRVGAIVHPFSNDHLPRWLELLGSRIMHLHLQRRADGTWADPLPDSPDVKDAMELLRQHGFQGTASLEFIAAIRTERDPSALMTAAQSVLARWKNQAVPWGD